MDPSDRTDRLMLVILNAEIICQLYRRFSGRQTEKAAGEIDHITVRLASKAVKAFINLHARIPVIVERASAHASVSHLQAVALSSLKGGHIILHCFK
jgi:hypothetical protein